MKPATIALLCTFFLLVHINVSQAGTKGKLGGITKLFKKPPKPSKDSTIKKSKKPTQSNQGSYPQQPGGYPNQGGHAQQPGSYPYPGGYPQQPGSYPNQGGYPQQPGGYPNQGGHAQQPGGYPNQGRHPQQPGSYPYPGGYPQQPGSYPNQGGYPQQPGGYPNQGGHAQQPGGYPNQGRHPQQPGSYPYPGGYPQQPGSYPYPGGYPQQPGSYPNQGGYPQQPGRQGYPYLGSHPQQSGGYPSHGSYPNQPGYPARGYPAGGFPAQSNPYGGGYGTYGGYPGGYINSNPNNKIVSPHYGGSFGYGGYGGGGGSPFSHSVNAMGYAPSDKSRGFGRSAVMAAAGGAVAGMALGYGLGRFPRPNFAFHSPQEEYYYNYYMYRKYGTRSTDTNDYSRDYKYSETIESFDRFMTSCMKRTDLLPVEKRNQHNKPITTTTVTSKVLHTTTAATVTSIGSNSTSNNKVPDNSSTTRTPTTNPLNTSEVNPAQPALQVSKNATTTNDNKIVGTVEAGQPTTMAAPVIGNRNHTTNSTTMAEKHSPTTSPLTPHTLEKSEVNPAPPPSLFLKDATATVTGATDDDDGDLVSIVEIGYPALIKQMKVKRCTELYIVYSEKHLKKKTTPPPAPPRGGVLGMVRDSGRHLFVVTSTILILLNVT